MTDTTQAGGDAPSNTTPPAAADTSSSPSPLHQPVPPARREADARTSRVNRRVDRIAEPRSPGDLARLSPQQRWDLDEQARRDANPYIDPSRVLVRDPATGAVVPADQKYFWRGKVDDKR
jgi:hypothetical protein